VDVDEERAVQGEQGGVSATIEEAADGRMRELVVPHGEVWPRPGMRPQPITGLKHNE